MRFPTILARRCSGYRSIDHIFGQYKERNDINSVALDVGSGPSPKNPFHASKLYGVDIRAKPENNVYYADLSKDKLPFEDCVFDYVTAFDVLEHIPRFSNSENHGAFPFIDLMDEIFRVLKPGGVFFNLQPCYPELEAFQDPTHVNIMTEDTILKYFCEQAWARIYGYVGTFEMVHEGWLHGKYFSLIRKTSVIGIKDTSFIQK
jgi:SAM-dependent methyltransferase